MILSTDNIFWFDSETSGFDENNNQMLSFAIVCTDENFKVLDQYYSLIKLNGISSVTEQALQINKIDLNSELYLKNSISESQLVDNVFDFINKNETEHSLMIAHNEPFDSKFFNATVKRTNKANKIENIKKLCTMKFFRKLVNDGLINTIELEDKNKKKYKSAKLEHITQALNINHHSHNALGDTLALIEAYKIGIKLLNNQDYFTIHSKIK